ncbi:MAG: 16S rRNA (uracil(1498)-N(3))-methyltransferase [Coriobacteriia bacterium]|nr:16S rRNA (uracil(1498)-N(3))-methyltransferase [Coriobacteriia bacterium]
MSSHRFFLESMLPPETGRLSLSVSDTHHAISVLRLTAGTEITVVEPDGSAWTVLVKEVGPSGLVAEKVGRLPDTPAYRITLLQGVAKGTKVDLVVEKATELNIEAVVPVLTERSVVHLATEKLRSRGDRWRRVAIAAAKQSRRTSVPVVTDPLPLAEVYPLLAEFDVVLAVWEGASATGPGIGQALDEAAATPESRVVLVVGPEGGLTSEEVYALEASGARAVTLGDTVLRSETAGIVATALCVYELGGLGGRPRG